MTADTAKKQYKNPDRLKNLVDYFIREGKGVDETLDLALKIYEPSLYYPARKKILEYYCSSVHPAKKDQVFSVDEIRVIMPSTQRNKNKKATVAICSDYIPRNR